MEAKIKASRENETFKREWILQASHTARPKAPHCWKFSRLRLTCSSENQKNPRVRKIFCPQWKWLRQFYGRLKKSVLSAGQSHVHKIPHFRGGGHFGFLGGEVPILFCGCEDFSERKKAKTKKFRALKREWSFICGPRVGILSGGIWKNGTSWRPLSGPPCIPALLKTDTPLGGPWRATPAPLRAFLGL